MSTPADQDSKYALLNCRRSANVALMELAAWHRLTSARPVTWFAIVICFAISIQSAASQSSEPRRTAQVLRPTLQAATLFDAVRLRLGAGRHAPTFQTSRAAAVRTVVPAVRVCQVQAHRATPAARQAAAPAARQVAARQSHLLRLHQFRARVNRARTAQAAAPAAHNQVHQNHQDNRR